MNTYYTAAFSRRTAGKNIQQLLNGRDLELGFEM